MKLQESDVIEPKSPERLTLSDLVTLWMSSTRHVDGVAPFSML